MQVMKRRSRVWQAQLRPVGTDHSEPLLSTVVATFKDFQTWPTMNIVFSFVVPEESAIAARANLCQLAVIGVGSKFRSAAAAKKNAKRLVFTPQKAQPTLQKPWLLYPVQYL